MGARTGSPGQLSVVRSYFAGCDEWLDWMLNLFVAVDRCYVTLVCRCIRKPAQTLFVNGCIAHVIMAMCSIRGALVPKCCSSRAMKSVLPVTDSGERVVLFSGCSCTTCPGFRQRVCKAFTFEHLSHARSFSFVSIYVRVLCIVAKLLNGCWIACLPLSCGMTWCNVLRRCRTGMSGFSAVDVFGRPRDSAVR